MTARLTGAPSRSRRAPGSERSRHAATPGLTSSGSSIRFGPVRCSLFDAADELWEFSMAEHLPHGGCLANVRPIVVRQTLEHRADIRALSTPVDNRPLQQVARAQSVKEGIDLQYDALPGRAYDSQRWGTSRKSAGKCVEEGLDADPLGTLKPANALVPGQVAHHPGDRVHGLEPARAVFLGEALKPTQPLRAGEAKLFNAWVNRQFHFRNSLSTAIPTQVRVYSAHACLIRE